MKTFLLAAGVLTLLAPNSAMAHEGHEREPDRHSAQTQRSFYLRLSGSEVPGGGDDKGRGVASLWLDPQDEVVCLRASWRDVAGQVTAIHIHEAPKGETGPHHIDIIGGESLPGRRNRLETCVQVTGGDEHGGDPADRIQEIIDEPSDFYLNVHSTAFPDGALRGQFDNS